MFPNITEETPFELLDNGSARLYIHFGVVESVFYKFHLICEKNNILYTHFTNRENIRREALQIMMEQAKISDYKLIPGRLKYTNYIDFDLEKVLIIKFKNSADEAFFRLHYSNSFFDTTEADSSFITEN